jgi:uncharacterized protein with GYD domain
MPSYLVQVAYESAAVAALVKKPQDRLAVVSKVVQKLGGTLVGGWLCFGDYDTVVVADFPDNVSAAAFALAIASGGSCRNVKTTPLLSVDEGQAAMKKAGGTGYRAVAK